MPSHKFARLRVAAHYLGVLDALNDDYLKGGEKQAQSVQSFDLERLNMVSALAKISPAVGTAEVAQEWTEIDRALLDLCNAYPDAGSHLIILKINSQDRIRWLKDALQASRMLHNDLTTQAHLGNLGLAHYELGELSEAENYFLQALQLAEEINDRSHQGAWLGNLGNVYALFSDHHRAIGFHQKHLEIAGSINDEQGTGHALANLGVSYAYLGELDKALENYQRFLDISIQRGDRREESQAYMNMGFVYYDMRLLEESERCLRSAEEIALEFHDIPTYCLVLGGIADIEIDRQKYARAIQLLTEALGMLTEVNDMRTELRLLQSLGNAYLASDEYEKALIIYSRLYELSANMGMKATMCTALVNQVSVHRHRDDFTAGFEAGEKALELAGEIESLSDEAFVRWQFALMYEAIGNEEQAITELYRVIEIESQNTSPFLEDHQAQLKRLLMKR